jgi:hypothetical protein
MHDFSITLLHSFANFQFFNQWNGYISVVILKDCLARHDFEAGFVDLSSILSDYLLDTWYVEKRREALSREIDSVERRLEIEDTPYYLRDVFLAYLLQGSMKEKEPHEMMCHFFKKDPKLYQLFVQPLDVSAFQDVGPEDVQSTRGVKFFENMLMRVLPRIPPASVFGITVPSKLHLNSSIALSRLLRALYPSSHICLGGPYISLVDKRWLDVFVESSVIDTYITEDGEGKFIRLLKQLRSEDAPPVKGLFEEGHHPSVNELVRTTETPDEDRANLF